MTSDQTCPLCGKDLHYAMQLGVLRCVNHDCCLYRVELSRIKFRCLTSQISRIRQEAKQELINEIESHMGIVIIINKKKGVE